MRYLKKLLGVVVVGLGVSASPSFATSLNVEFGQLTGADDVNVNGTLYNVRFVDGTCVALFDGCNEVSDFTFTTLATADAASRALIGHVFVDGSSGNFDTNPALTQGIGSSAIAHILTPYSLDSGDTAFIFARQAINGNGGLSADDDTTSGWEGETTWDSSSDSAASYYTYAVWTPAAVVPLPAGGLLLLSALGGIAALRRRKKRTA